MGRILAVDYGKKRVGLAVTDPLKIIATGLTTVDATSIWNFLEKYLGDEEVETIVVGYPRQLDNKPSESMQWVRPFISKLRKKFPETPIELVDERFTSQMAFQTMIDGGLRKKQRQNKRLIDTISATIILQSFLEQKNTKNILK